MLFDVELRARVTVDDVSITEAVIDTLRLEECILTRLDYVKSYIHPRIQSFSLEEAAKPVDMELHVATWHINRRIFKDGRYIMWVSPYNINARGLLQEKVVKQLKRDIEQEKFMQWIFEDD